MFELIFATNNSNKVTELQEAIGEKISILTLQQAGISIEIPEPYDTLEANAAVKAHTIFTLTGKNCFSEDTGLEVDALGGEPGVRSARYAGEDVTAGRNMEKLLRELGNNDHRSARFRTVISLLLDGQEYFFEGVCEGVIGSIPAGKHGFGYDPVFIPAGSSRTFGEMEMQEKSPYSHRKKAGDKLVSFLQHAANNRQPVHSKYK